MEDKNMQVPVAVPGHDDVEQLAFDLWQQRGRPFGSPAEDWFRAELILLGAALEESPSEPVNQPVLTPAE